MNLLNKTKKNCENFNIKPTRSKGQNFLINEDVYEDMIEASEIKKDDIILEIGPGLGFLSERLARKANKVVAIELDDKLFIFLENKFKKENISNIRIINKDILKIFNLSDCFSQEEIKKYKIVANLPYNITSIFLRKFLENIDLRPKNITLMLQKETAERIVASPGKMSLLSVSVQLYAKVEIIKYVLKENFWPMPEVDSAIINIVPFSSLENRFDKKNEKFFFQMIKHGFSSRRKMLKNNLAGGYGISNQKAEEILTKSGFNKKIRAQELSVDEWKKLFVVLRSSML
jgi:16S rRNA (adenine1518-N6/adenine1519-N6)-dimethyltransferase